MSEDEKPTVSPELREMLRELCDREFCVVEGCARPAKVLGRCQECNDSWCQVTANTAGKLAQFLKGFKK